MRGSLGDGLQKIGITIINSLSNTPAVDNTNVPVIDDTNTSVQGKILDKEFDMLYDHFDENTGIFKESISKIISNISPSDFSDNKRRTYFVLAWIKKTYPQRQDLFDHFYKLVAAKNIFIKAASSF